MESEAPLPRTRLRGRLPVASLLLVMATTCGGEELPGFESAITQVFEKAAPAVVHIHALVGGRTQVPYYYDPFEGRLYAGPPQRSEPRRAGEGSGFVFDASGLVLTNEHVVAGADKLVVTLADERELDAVVVGTDREHDVAVLRIDDPDLQGDLPASMVATLGDSSGIKVGQWVVAIGAPFGLSKTVSAGIVSAMGRELDIGRDREYFNLIQTDAAINPGNSGGPLLDLRGHVVAINTAINAQGQGLGFALPINLARKVAADLVRTGSYQRTWLGIEPRDVTPGVARHLGLSQPRGVYLSRVVPGGPAAGVGLEAGDVVLEVRGKTLKDSTVLIEQIQETRAGSPLPLKVLKRDGSLVEVAPIVRALGETDASPETSGPGARKDRSVAFPELGLRGVAVQDADRLPPGLPDRLEGVLVLEIERGGHGAALGLRQGDVITRVGRVATPDVLRLRRLLRTLAPEDGHFLTVLRGDRWLFLGDG